MIVDKIENAQLYQGLHPGIDKALEYIKNTNFSDLPFGKHEIEGDAVFVILKEYETKQIDGNLLESHLKYIDVQYIIEGVEQMGVTMRTDQLPKKAYDADDDYMLFDESYDIITVKEGMFAIFFPDDIHMPDMTTGSPSHVKKAVFKVKIQNS
ncbi:YhcH/YjgK/YiaL family protein [Gelidibacter salicanalis]|uniref:YhcH/YjgK/YiaL family protein n=1 Tax=Gelidibacter salicanalis TaxID=291193 RepID=A0A934KM60_9FLAO|nr:YhcH/YjgK/YiaL family protein [Gelidibacter salicanalis]MBJ7879789.1 YhcH/YjgK/YiaL family protein [Gelidibacter salicanalis]